MPEELAFVPQGVGKEAPEKVSTSECLPVLIDLLLVQPIDGSFVAPAAVAALYGFEVS